MTEHTSETDSQLILIDELEDFSRHSKKVVEETQREILILSNSLDPVLYNNQELYQKVLDMARADRRAKVKILVKNIRPVVEQGHRLLNLARRLSSKVEIRKLLITPEKDDITYLIGDKKYLLYMHEEQGYKGFANYNGAVECLALVDEFTYLWEKHSELDASLRTMLI